MKIKLAHSPDADDAFMFYGLAKGKLDTEGIEYEHVLKDIQTLNDWAREGRMEVTAISAHAYAYVKDKYDVLTHGGSIGQQLWPHGGGRRGHDHRPAQGPQDRRAGQTHQRLSGFEALPARISWKWSWISTASWTRW